MTITLGSCFAGIGGFELGFQSVIPNLEVLWQIENDPFCQKVLQKHWPKSKKYLDIRDVSELDQVDILVGGFPCQDISVAGNQKGLNGERSGLWFEMHRLCCLVRPRVIVLENVPAILNNGLSTILQQISEMGYDAEWIDLSAKAFGAPHLRRRWFLVAYSNRTTLRIEQVTNQRCNQTCVIGNTSDQRKSDTSNTARTYSKEQSRNTISLETEVRSERCSGKNARSYTRNYWERPAPEPTICRMDDGLPEWMGRRGLKALGNAIVPQCAAFIAENIMQSHIFDLQ